MPERNPPPKPLTDFEKYVKSKLENARQYDNKNKYVSLFASTQFPEFDADNQTVKEMMMQLFSHWDAASVADKTEKPVSQGQTKYLDLEAYFDPQCVAYKPHACTRACVAKYEVSIENVKNLNPLLMPLLHGWQRLICTQKKTLRVGSKKWIGYMGPCGRTLRNTAEVDRYLMLTDSKLTLDQFSFDYFIHVNREYEANARFLKREDITNKSEAVPISCVNCVDYSEPDKIHYSATRKPLEGVPLNTTEDFLDGCECTDNCRDRSKCACWRKTFEATLFGNNSEINTEVGYRGRRLPNIVTTGIFECNSKCKCDRRCSNKVVQNGISVRLQLFKTVQKGWGLRCKLFFYFKQRYL